MQFKQAFLATLVVLASAQEELLQNADFEQPFTEDDWVTFCGSLTQDTDAYSGTYAAKLTDRTEEWCTVTQYVSLQPNTHYAFRAVIKSLTLLDGSLYHPAQLNVEIDYAGGGNEYRGHCSLPYLRPDHGWQQMAGDFYLGDKEITQARVFIQISTTGVDYLVDSASLTAIPVDPDWRDAANQRIEKIRMNDITINLRVSESYDPTDISLELEQTSHAFAFGSAIVDAQIAGDDDYNVKYQDCFYTHFNWAVQEYNLKWNTMEPEQGDVDFALTDAALQRLSDRNVPTRGHCTFWGKEEHVPDWLKDTTPDFIRSEITRRIDYLVTRYRDVMMHWDVNNEQEHGPWFEENTRDVSIMAEMFNQTHAHDPDSLLFLNEYGVVTYSQAAQALVNTADRLTLGGASVGGIGAQSHFNSVPDITAINNRLDVLERGGYPVWITELDIDVADVTQRADILDDLMTLYFSRSIVGGVLLWGFSDNHGPCRDTCSLFEGDDFVPNAAGERWIEMLTARWHTSAAFTPSSAEESFGTRGFYGGYQIKVSHNGDEIKSENFTLPVDSAVTVFIEV